MPQFAYKAHNADGVTVTGVVEGANEAEALQILREHELDPLSLRPYAKSFILRANELFGRVKTKDLVIFSRQLAVMMEANVPLVEALEIVVKQTENPRLRTTLAEVATDIEGGMALSKALAKHPRAFGDFFVSIVRSGETSGQLAEVLGYLADQQEKDYDLMNRIRGAMMYPAFIVTGLIIVGVIMMIFVVPRITAILTEVGAELPITTRILIGTSDFLASYWWFVLILLIGIGVGIRFAIRRPQGRYIWDSLKLRLPVFGPLFQKIYVVRFTQSLGTLIAGKVPVTVGLGVVSDIVGNAVFQRLIDETILAVEDGDSLTTVLADSDYVPAMLSQMLAIGEQTGRLEEVLDRLTHFYTREIDNTVRNLVTLIEPMVMLLMGGAVGIMVSAIILPIYNLSGSI